MIKAEVIFDGDSITVNGKKFYVHAEYSYDTYCELINTQDEFDTIEQAVKHCMEN